MNHLFNLVLILEYGTAIVNQNNALCSVSKYVHVGVHIVQVYDQLQARKIL